MGPQLKVWPAQAGGAQKSLGAAPAPAVFLVDFKVAHALVVAPVEVRRLRNSGLSRRLRKGVQYIPAQALFFNPPFAASIAVTQDFLIRVCFVLHQLGRRAACAMQRVNPFVVVFMQFEIRQHIVPAPVVVARELRPLVVIVGLAAHVNHAVDAGAAAQRLAARVAQRAAIQPGVGFGAVKPVGARVADAVQITHGDMNPVVVVLAAGLDQQHTFGGVSAQTVGQQAAGRASADDDVVEVVAQKTSCGPLLRA